ncbi:coenzyme F420-0:L-glutamate ligase [Proteiniclasticum sp. SCR006]|uniref:Coenzyme F420-0:L-glutamate ligase n=1 Tax=Proteiniclasticum aestuarii TaxID=2817862 RepID=A0A939H6W7_9CLOT|nr:coenzyme F420-0:L-glutamate ligase [Proteiniclasticum aestuarii]MBO1263584.1 coenzyme F420-0:L-glutamate ligase [Proteiniclasticum aestuarii]
MERMIGTTSRGIRAPIIREGDDIASIVVESVIKAAASEQIVLNDRDVVSVTEAVVARAQGNYASVDDIAEDVKKKFQDETIGVIFPILSRNRFSLCLKGIARGARKVVLMLSYPSDEVGNALVSLDQLDEKGVDPYMDVLTEEKYRSLFGYEKHTFTGVDYISFYKKIIEEEGCEAEVILANQPNAILSYTKSVLNCDIHSRERTKRLLKRDGAEVVFSLSDILNSSMDGSGYNKEYGLLGSNKATEETLKLFPRDGQEIVDRIQKMFKEQTGKEIEVMIYGDGAFKDPVGGIWELADPVVSPAYTKGLEGQPNEIKLKYIADNEFSHLEGEELKKAITEYIRNKGENLFGDMTAEGTTPRRITDLLGSLSDLTSGSGDKGTPIILIQGYFDSYAK